VMRKMSPKSMTTPPKRTQSPSPLFDMCIQIVMVIRQPWNEIPSCDGTLRALGGCD